MTAVKTNPTAPARRRYTSRADLDLAVIAAIHAEQDAEAARGDLWDKRGVAILLVLLVAAVSTIVLVQPPG